MHPVDVLPPPPAGPLVGDERLKKALTNDYKHDALLQLLLHAVRVLVEYGALLQQPSQQQGQGQQAGRQEQQQQPSSEEEVEDGERGAAAVATRSVGLQELLSAVQELGRVSLRGGGCKSGGCCAA